MSALIKRTKKKAEGLVGKWVVLDSDPYRGLYQCLGWSHSGFRLVVSKFSDTSGDLPTIKTRKYREATPVEIAAYVTDRIRGAAPF